MTSVHAVAETPRRKRFSRQEIERLLQTDFFVGQRCELIDGDLIDKSGQSPAHASTIHRVQVRLLSIVDCERLLCQMPVELTGEAGDWSVPEPDLAILREPNAEHEWRHPRADELVLAIEVADTCAWFDLSVKAAMYAQAGVPEYWVVDLPRRALVVHSRPESSQYRRLEILTRKDRTSIDGWSVSIPVGDLLPPRDRSGEDSR